MMVQLLVMKAMVLAFVFVQLLIQLLVPPICVFAFNFIACPGRKPWPVDYNHSVVENDARILQNWLYAYQHNSERCKRGPEKYFSQYGLGNG